MPEQFGEKTIEPTPHRLQQARSQGQVARSQDLSSALVLIGGLIALLYMGGSLASFLSNLMRRQLGAAPPLSADAPPQSNYGQAKWHEMLTEIGSALLPFLAVLLLIALAAQLIQVGFLFVPRKLAPDISHVSPLKNATRIFSGASVVRLLLGIGKLAVVGGVAIWSVADQRAALVASAEMAPAAVGAFWADFLLGTLLKIGTALLVLALLDYWYQRQKRRQELMMTVQEFKEEMKNTEGDPQIAERRRHLHRQIVTGQIARAVPQATAVVSNPTHLAVAIKYDLETMPAPIVVAKGAGAIAQRIRRNALEHGIPVIERKELAQALYKRVDLNQQIPPEQYEAVAEVLRYVYQLKGEIPRQLSLGREAA